MNNSLNEMAASRGSLRRRGQRPLARVGSAFRGDASGPTQL